MKKYAIGVDIGGSHVLAVAVDVQSGELEESTRVHQAIDSQGTREQIFSAWADIMNQAIGKLGKEQVLGIGLAMPGPFDYSKGIALFKGNEKYEAIYGLQVEEFLRPLLTVSKVAIRFHNDASCFAIGEDGYGGAKGTQRSLSLTLGTGFGSAFIDNGIPIVIREDVPEDGCLWHLPFNDGIADQYFSTRWFRNQYEHETGMRISGVKELVSLAKTNAAAVNLFRVFGSNLADFLSPWLEGFRPEVVMLGGNISKASKHFLPSFQEAIGHHPYQPEIRLTDLGEDAAIMGAARLLDDTYYAKIKDFLPTK